MRVSRQHSFYRHVRSSGITMIRRLTCPVADRRHNQSLSSAGPRILFLRHYHPQGDYHWDFFRWLARHHPALHARCELRRVGWQPAKLDDYALLVPLVQDPLKECFPRAYEAVWQVQQACDAAGIPVVNRIERLSNSRKSVALRLIGSCGLRCPRVIPVRSHEQLIAAAEILGHPFVLRDDLRHGAITVVHEPAMLDALRHADFTDQIACEFIHTSDELGLYRKYRYVLVGDEGAPRHLIPSEDPVVRTDQRKDGLHFQAEEAFYLTTGDPNHHRLDRARRALGLDVVAFDYSYDRDGQVVVWEPNPFAVLWDHHSEAKREHLRHQEPALDRIYGLFAHYYADRAGLGRLVTDARLAA